MQRDEPIFDTSVHMQPFVTARCFPTDDIVAQTIMPLKHYVLKLRSMLHVIPDDCIVVAECDMPYFAHINDDDPWKIVFESSEPIDTTVFTVLRSKTVSSFPCTAVTTAQPFEDAVTPRAVAQHTGEGSSSSRAKKKELRLFVKNKGTVKRAFQTKVILLALDDMGVKGHYTEHRQECGTKRMQFVASARGAKCFVNLHACLAHIQERFNVDLKEVLATEEHRCMSVQRLSAEHFTGNGAVRVPGS